MTRWLCGAIAMLCAVVVFSSGLQGAPRQAPPAAAAASAAYVDVYNGWKWWHVYCYRCHGVDASGSTTAPNVSDPALKITRAGFIKSVRTGVPDTAMQGWSKLLDDKQIEQLYVYVKARTDKVLPPGRPDEIGPGGGRWVPPATWRTR
jgi:mono/diheme cytochrome c family protein